MVDSDDLPNGAGGLGSLVLVHGLGYSHGLSLENHLAGYIMGIVS